VSLPGLAEAIRSIDGAFRIARFDPTARNYFDLSAEGFWRSFGAMVYVAPLYLIFIHLPGMRQSLHAAEPFIGYPIETANYVLRWLSFPFLLYWLARPFGLSGNYIPFVVAYNWSQVVQILFFLLPAAIVSFGLLPGPVGRGVMTFIVIATFAYQLVIARTMLAVAWSFAFGIVCLDWALGFFVDRVSEWLIYQLSAGAAPADLGA